jgi:hypothetical protein
MTDPSAKNATVATASIDDDQAVISMPSSATPGQSRLLLAHLPSFELLTIMTDFVESGRLRLISLPRDVTYRILECLLKAEEVIIEKKDDRVVPTFVYEFETDILRTCKYLHGLGMTIFRLNRFLLVSTTNSTQLDSLKRLRFGF